MKKKKKQKPKKKSAKEADTLREMLLSYGLEISTVKGDGNCLFRSFALQHSGEEERYGEYREACCDFLSLHASDFRAFHDNYEESFEDYLNKMREDATWGSQIELSALCLCYNVSAVVFQPDGVHLELGLAEPEQQTVLLSFHDDEHFNSVKFIGGGELETLAEVRKRIIELKGTRRIKSQSLVQV